jgi:rSAM/selenodomain-associated transferase 1
MPNVLAIFAKAPIEGQVKTRLCPPLTLKQAAELATCFLLDTVERVCLLPDIQVFVAFTPVDSEPIFRALLPFSVEYVPQRGNSLGERELNVFCDLQQQGAESIVLIGSDIPTLPLTHLQEAFTMLKDPHCDAVLGPTSDGGYCLIGMRYPHQPLFENIAWSTATVLSDTLTQARKHNLNAVVIPVWYDVDDRAGLSHLANELRDPMVAAGAPRTRAMLTQLGFFRE